MFELTRNANNSPWGQGVAEILLVFYVQEAGVERHRDGASWTSAGKKKRRTEVRRGTRDFVKWN
jgi:hypothetical protein